MRTEDELIQLTKSQVEVIQQKVIEIGEHNEWLQAQLTEQTFQLIRMGTAFRNASPEQCDQYWKDEYAFRCANAPKRCEECDGNNDCEGGCEYK
jgi:hypothetical protein